MDSRKPPIYNMKFMFFVDYDNFKNYFLSKTDAYPDFAKVPDFLFKKINELRNWERYNPRLIRTYVYSGEYTKEITKKIKNKIARSGDYDKNKIEKFLSKVRKEKSIQDCCFSRFIKLPFVELKLKPLQFSAKELRLFQKGTDVQLAVDLVHHAYRNNFDVAIVCSGDVDLLESIKLVKNQGKKIVLVAHPGSLASDMEKECDFFFNMAKVNDEELKKLCFYITDKNNKSGNI